MNEVDFFEEVKKACESTECHRDVFILMDNVFDATAELVDNFSLFEYMQNNGKYREKSFYLVNEQSIQFCEIKNKYGDKIIPFSPYRRNYEKLLSVLTKTKYWLDSFQVINLLGIRGIVFSSPIITIYTQHGINYFKVGYLGNRWIGNDTFKKIIFSSKKERELLKKYYTYNDQDTIIAGLSRWDNLADSTERVVLFYFTGREYLRTGINIYDTEYFKNIQDLIRSECLQKIAKFNKVKIYIALHHTIRQLFNFKSDFLYFLDDGDVGKIKNVASMLVTDYSSMCFDFMYKDRPVVFFRIDANSKYVKNSEDSKANNECVESKNEELYNICYSAKNAISKIKGYVDNNFQLEEEYKEVNNSFFSIRSNIRQTILDCIELSHKTVFDIDSYKKNNNFFPTIQTPCSCKFSKELPFNVSGLSLRELDGRWTDGKDVYFNLKVDPNKILRMEFKFHRYKTVKLVEVFTNERMVAEWRFDDERAVSKEIYISRTPSNGNLQLHFRIFNVKNVSGRELGLFFTELKLGAALDTHGEEKDMRTINIFLKKIWYKAKSLVPGKKKNASMEKYRRIKEAINNSPREVLYLCGIKLCESATVGNTKSYSILNVPFVTRKREQLKEVLYIFGVTVFKRKIERLATEDRLDISNNIIDYDYKDDLQSVKKKLKVIAEHKKNIYVDISKLAKHDAGTGIQRVTRNILFNLLKKPPEGYDVLPIYLHETGHRVAYSYLRKTSNFISDENDHKVIFLPGDIVLLPELFWDPIYEKYFESGNMQKIRANGAKVFVILYDLLPVRYPQYVADHHVGYFEKYLREISKLDGVVTISEFVAEDYKMWRMDNGIETKKDFLIDWFHLGSDIDISSQTSGIPKDADAIWESISKRPTLLQVSTVEPRKGYGQALGAFEKLWNDGIDVNFIIVGREGWKIDQLKRKLKNHKELGHRLFWLQGISDEYLDEIYARTDGVLFASEAEGFGLAVIEGAQHGKPLILRDIPVFREIAGPHATYFSGNDYQSLANCIEKWLLNYKNGKVISSKEIKPLTWEESIQMLISKLPLQE